MDIFQNTLEMGNMLSYDEIFEHVTPRKPFNINFQKFRSKHLRICKNSWETISERFFLCTTSMTTNIPKSQPVMRIERVLTIRLSSGCLSTRYIMYIKVPIDNIIVYRLRQKVITKTTASAANDTVSALPSQFILKRNQMRFNF